MSTPDFELLRIFGNEDVYFAKLAGRPELLARLALGLMGYGAGRNELSRQRALRAEAAEMNEAFERMQAMKLQQAESSARHTRVPLIIPSPVAGMRRWDGDSVLVGMDEGMVRLASVASDVGADMAKEALTLPAIGAAVQGLKATAGKVVGAVSQAPKVPTITGAATTAAGAVQKAPKPPPALGDSAQAFGFKIQRGLQQAGLTSPRKAAMTAGGLALGGLAIKGAVGGVRKGTDIMSREAGPMQFGSQQHGGSRVPYGINEYGQPDLRSPFM